MRHHAHVDGDADIATGAAAIGHPARGRMLAALLGGHALSAGALARVGRVSPATASGHLGRLVDARLVVAERRGRERLHRLASADVAHAIETLATIAPSSPARTLREGSRSAAERSARSCYDHVAGVLGVAISDRLCDLGALEPDSLALRDPAPLAPLGVDPTRIDAGRRPLTRSCLDWTERRPHLAGALGAALLDALLRRGWVARRPEGRALLLTPTGTTGLRSALGLELSA